MTNENRILLLTTTDTQKDILWEGQGKYDDAILRLQTRFSEWLKMENICVLAGAGTSKKYGGLTLRELAKTLISLLENHYVSNKKTDHLEQFFLVSETLKSNPGNLEKWISQLKGVSYLLEHNLIGKTIIKIKEQEISVEIIKDIVKDIERFIFLLCTLRLNSEDKTSHVTGYHSFIAKLLNRDPSLGRVKLFTLNYDTLFEQALDDLGIFYADGFVGSVKRKFNPSCYGLDYYYPGDISEGRVRRYDRFMHLYKLHGSINWREINKLGKPVESVPVDLETINSLRQKIIEKIKNEDAFDEKMITGIEELLIKRETLGILPTSSKYIETLQMPYAHMFRSLEESLQNPQTFLLLIGYGFGDEHVNRIIEDGLTNPSLIVCFIEPFALDESNKIKNEKIREYLSLGMRGRIFLLTEQNPDPLDLKTGFENLSIDLMPDVRMLDQWIKLRKLENKLRKHLSESESETTEENNEK